MTGELLAYGEAVLLADLGETLALACLAADAEVHDLSHALAGQLLGWESAVEDRAEHVSSRAGGVFLVQGDHVRGAHRAGVLLAAEAGSEASLHGVGETALLREVQVRFYRKPLVSRADAELLVHRRWVHDHTGVQHAFGVPGLLHLGEGSYDLWAVHSIEELGAGEPVAVLAGDGTAKLRHEVGDLLGDVPHPHDPIRVR